jgi:hypothetical protein
MHNQGDESDDEEQVDQPSDDVKCKPGGSPNDEQDKKQNQKNEVSKHFPLPANSKILSFTMRGASLVPLPPCASHASDVRLRSFWPGEIGVPIQRINHRLHPRGAGFKLSERIQKARPSRGFGTSQPLKSAIQS